MEEPTALDDVFSSNHGPNVPTIMPRQRYAGAQNVATVKDGDAMHSV